jgi:hypothetical protein
LRQADKTVYAKFSRKRFRKLVKKLSDEGVTIIGKWRLMIMGNLVGY